MFIWKLQSLGFLTTDNKCLAADVLPCWSFAGWFYGPRHTRPLKPMGEVKQTAVTSKRIVMNLRCEKNRLSMLKPKLPSCPLWAIYLARKLFAIKLGTDLRIGTQKERQQHQTKKIPCDCGHWAMGIFDKKKLGVVVVRGQLSAASLLKYYLPRIQI